MLWLEGLCPISTPAPTNLYVKALIPKVPVLGGGAFGRRLGQRMEPSINGISALIKEPPESSSSPPD